MTFSASRARKIDNSHPALKRKLREDFIGPGRHRLCLDLFCGKGTYHGLYSDRFEQVIGVDSDAKKLSKATRRPNIKLFKSNNSKIIIPLLLEFGLPDFIDIDAYGNPDAPLIEARLALNRSPGFSLVATDGTLERRKSAMPTVPRCWGYPESVCWSRGAIMRGDYPTLIVQHLREWFPALELTRFEAFVGAMHSGIWYYGATLVRRGGSGA